MKKDRVFGNEDRDYKEPLPLLVSYEYTVGTGNAAMSGTVVLRGIPCMTPGKKKEIEDNVKKKIEAGYKTEVSVISVTGWQRFEGDD